MMTGTLDTFTMPNLATRASARGNTICLFSSTETILWTFAGGRSTTLDISHLGARASTVGDYPSILFHPLREDVVFLYHTPGVTEIDQECLVSEYKDGVFVKLHSFQFPEHEIDEEVDFWDDGRAMTEPRQISTYGDYALRPIWLFYCTNGTGSPPARAGPFGCRILRLECFNVLTSEFTLRTFPTFPHLPEVDEDSVAQDPASWALWGTRMTSWHYPDRFRDRTALYLLPLRVTGEGVLGCTAIRIPPAYCTSVEEGTGIMRRKLQTAKSLLEKIGAVSKDPSLDDFSLPESGYIMDNCFSRIGQPHPENNRYPISRDVWTDGNFTVLRINNHLTIWSFHSDLKPAPI